MEDGKHGTYNNDCPSSLNTYYHVVGIGNAIVDVLAKCSDEFLISKGIEKGIMQLIDTPRAAEIYNSMDAGVE